MTHLYSLAMTIISCMAGLLRLQKDITLHAAEVAIHIHAAKGLLLCLL